MITFVVLFYNHKGDVDEISSWTNKGQGDRLPPRYYTYEPMIKNAVASKIEAFAVVDGTKFLLWNLENV
jgi:hypothetical protein